MTFSSPSRLVHVHEAWSCVFSNTIQCAKAPLLLLADIGNGRFSIIPV